jgi:hypothetical protein
MRTDEIGAETAIWARIIEPDRNGLPPAVARFFLQLKFNDEDRARMSELAQRNNEGLLSEAERRLLESYVKVGDVLSLLRLKARRSLKN